MSKRVSKIKCARCGKKFAPPPRGRRPKYCSRSCRQRTYEARAEQRKLPFRLMARDLESAKVKAEVRRLVVEVLEELVERAEKGEQPARPGLRLVWDRDEQGDDDKG